MTTENQRLADLIHAIEEFHCPQWVKDEAFELFGIESKTIYKNPLSEQMDRINGLFEEPKTADVDILAMIRKRHSKD
jgi:hypothetical protein